MENIHEFVAQAIREYRIENRLNQTDFAKLVGSSHPSISAFENGDRLPSKDVWQNMISAGVNLPEYQDSSGRMDVLDDFGIRLRSFRKARGLHQDELGGLLSISQVQISRLELGKVKPSKEEYEKLQSIGFDMDQPMPDNTTALLQRLTPDTEEYATIGEAIQGFRKKNRLTQEQFASLAKISGGQVRRLEYGECSSNKVVISRMLDLGVKIPAECMGYEPHSIAEAILKYRERTGLTQKQVADMIGASRYSITAWEEGIRTPKLDTLCKLRDIGVDFSGTPEGKCLDDDPERIGKAVRRYRERRGISRYELAEKLGVSYGAAYTWETGTSIPSTEQWRKLLEMGVDFSADAVERQ